MISSNTSVTVLSPGRAEEYLLQPGALEILFEGQKGPATDALLPSPFLDTDLPKLTNSSAHLFLQVSERTHILSVLLDY